MPDRIPKVHGRQVDEEPEPEWTVPTAVREAGIPPDLWRYAEDRAERSAIVRVVREAVGGDPWWGARIRLPSITIGSVVIAGGEYEIRAVLVLLGVSIASLYALPADVRAWGMRQFEAPAISAPPPDIPSAFPNTEPTI